MPKITLNLQISKKKKTKKKTKKYKGKIGRELVRDNVGTNQLLDYNDLNNLLEPNQSINTDDQNKYYDYIDNLRAQQAYQLYGGDPNEQYQLKKVSKKLYNNLKNSLFDDNIRQDNIMGPPPDNEPIISNSWDAVPGGTATSIGDRRSAFISSFVEPVENVGSSSSVQIVDAYNFPTADIVDFDPLAYMKQEIRNKLSKDKYQIGYPSNATIVKWFAPIKNKIKDEGFVFGENYKQIVRDVYTELYPDSVELIRTPQRPKTKPEPKETPEEIKIPKAIYTEYEYVRPRPPQRPKTKRSEAYKEIVKKSNEKLKEPKKTQRSKEDLYKMFESNEQLMNYSTDIPEPIKYPVKRPKTISKFKSNEELMNVSSDVPIGTVAKSKTTPAKKTPVKKPAKTAEQKAQELKEYRKKYYQSNKDKFKPKSKK